MTRGVRLGALAMLIATAMARSASSAPVCGETTCQPVAGSSFSHFMGLDCTGLEYHYPAYHGMDLRPYSWDGGGVGGTQGTTANPLSFKDTNGACTNRAVPGDLAGLLRIYRCGAGEQQCGSSCITSAQCCVAQDCTLGPASSTASCVSNQCVYACGAGYKTCGGACIPTSACCSAADCTTPDVCHKLPATCTSNACQYALNDGALCNADDTKCTPNDRCQNGVCQADTANAVKCVQKDCNTAACNPTTGNCDYTPTSGGACGASGCYTSGSCSAGMCSGTPKDCSAVSTTACTVPACDAASSACTVENAPNGTACTLADKCLEGVACSGGLCVGSPNACVPSSPCVFAECDPDTGACSESPLPAGTPCVSTDSCSLDGVCGTDGSCQASALPDGTPCERKMSCATGEPAACSAGRCRCPGEVVEMPDLGAAPDGGAAPERGSGCAMTSHAATSFGWMAALLLAVFAIARSRLLDAHRRVRAGRDP